MCVSMGSISFIWIPACRRRFSWLLVASLASALSLAIAGQSLPPLVVEGLLLAMLVGKVTIEILRNKSTPPADEEKIIEIDTQY